MFKSLNSFLLRQNINFFLNLRRQLQELFIYFLLQFDLNILHFGCFIFISHFFELVFLQFLCLRKRRKAGSWIPAFVKVRKFCFDFLTFLEGRRKVEIANHFFLFFLWGGIYIFCVVFSLSVGFYVVFALRRCVEVAILFESGHIWTLEGNVIWLSHHSGSYFTSRSILHLL